MKKIIFLELNEFNDALLRKASAAMNLKNIQRMLLLNHSTISTDDTYESDFLEPWVQWVSVHTGKPSSEHQIKHLGDIPHLGTKQIWEDLADKGISSGIWGAMNASRNGADGCKFFLPDPWTASEIAYPGELNDLLDPLRYISKNYLKKSNKELFQKLRSLLRVITVNKLGKHVLRELPGILKNTLKFKGKSFIYIGFIEYISTLLFLKYRENYKTEFSSIFINTLAHVQHHYWKDDNYSGPIAYGLTYVDKILGELFSRLNPNDIILIANGLSQKNTNDETPWILYRQLDQATFLNAVGIRHSKVESLMTHDAHIYFENEFECQFAKKVLGNATIQNQKLFLVESYLEDPLKLFYRICFTDEIDPSTSFTINNKSLPFLSLFKPIVKRTGKHIPISSLYTNAPNFPTTLKNHEIFQHLFPSSTINLGLHPFQLASLT